MENDSILDPQRTLDLIKEAQNSGKLKALPGTWFYFLVSFLIGLSFGLLSNQSILAIIPVCVLPVIVYIQKRKSGFWPTGFIPFLRQHSGLYKFSDYWQDLFKVKSYLLLINLLAILIMFSFPFLFINILEFRDNGNWWAPMATGAIMGFCQFVILINFRKFQIVKLTNNNE